jgi:hypothetical protein
MADMSGKVRAEFDAAAAVTLRAVTDGAETGADSDYETAVALSKLVDAYWDNGEVADGLIKVNVYVTAVTDANDNAYTFEVQACNDAAGAGAVEVARLEIDPSLGAEYYELYVSSKMIEKLAPSADFIRIGVTKTTSGGTPSVTYGAWMTFHGHG